MKYEIEEFKFEQNAVRSVWKDGEPWFVLSDVCKALDLTTPARVAQRLDEDERSVYNLGRQGEAIIVNESGLYAVILRSHKPEARKFRRWVTHEVLPSLRKTGSYSLSQAPEAELLREIQKLNETNLTLNETNLTLNETNLTLNEINQALNGIDQKLDILIKQNEQKKTNQKKTRKPLSPEPMPADEKLMILSAICDLSRKKQKVKISYVTFRKILISKFGRDMLPSRPSNYMKELAPELAEKNIRLERIGRNLKETNENNPKAGFIIADIS